MKHGSNSFSPYMLHVRAPYTYRTREAECQTNEMQCQQQTAWHAPCISVTVLICFARVAHGKSAPQADETCILATINDQPSYAQTPDIKRSLMLEILHACVIRSKHALQNVSSSHTFKPAAEAWTGNHTFCWPPTDNCFNGIWTTPTPALPVIRESLTAISNTCTNYAKSCPWCVATALALLQIMQGFTCAKQPKFALRA